MRVVRESATALLVLLPAVALLPKWVLILHTLGASGTQVFETGFGFGPYVHSLLTDGTFRSCSAAPYVRCDPSLCVYATRMPVLPLFYAGLAELVGTKSAAVAIAKCTLTAALLTFFLWSIVRDVRFSLPVVVLAYALYLGPQVLKHGASLEYEEGLLVDLEACLGLAAAYLINPGLSAIYVKRAGMAFAAVLLATVLYFIKTTALPMLLVILALVVCDRELKWRFKWLALVCAAIPFVGWMAHNYASSGTVQLSSSWNGENLYRGSSTEGTQLYPEVLLDRIFDSNRATLADGRVVELHNLKARRCFRDEWSWSRYYSDLAVAWLAHHPVEALRFTARKAWVAFIELRHTPYRMATEGAATEYPPAVSAAMSVWMGFARLTFLVLLVLTIRGVWGGPRRQAVWTLTLIGAGFAPYVAVFVYQRHVVPLLVMAGFVLLALYLGEPRNRAEVT